MRVPVTHKRVPGSIPKRAMCGIRRPRRKKTKKGGYEPSQPFTDEWMDTDCLGCLRALKATKEHRES